MENNFSVDQSFKVIKETIEQARIKFEKSGIVFIFWGLVIATISFGYYFLRKAGLEKAYLINWLYLVAALLTFVYFTVKYSKEKKSKNFLASLLGWMWLILNINIFVVAFGFHNLGFVSTFIIMLIISIGYFVSSVMLRSGILVIGALMMNLGAYFSLYLNNVDELLIYMGVIALVCIFLPGVLMELKARKK